MIQKSNLKREIDLFKIMRIIPLAYFAITVIGCSSFGTYFTATDDEQQYQRKNPCNPTMVFKTDKTIFDKYELIGICESKRPSGTIGNKQNYAMTEIRKCACENGGDLIRIVDFEEINQEEEPTLETNVRRNMGSTYNDTVVAEIYIKK